MKQYVHMQFYIITASTNCIVLYSTYCYGMVLFYIAIVHTAMAHIVNETIVKE